MCLHGCITASTNLWYAAHYKHYNTFYYRPKRSFGQGNVFIGVCHSVNRGGVPDQAHPPSGRYTPLAGTPPWQVHPLWQVHPPGRYTPLAATPPWQLHPPGSYTPLAGTPQQVHTPPGRYPPSGRYTPPQKQKTPEYGQRSAGTHPTGMHSCHQCQQWANNGIRIYFNWIPDSKFLRNIRMKVIYDISFPTQPKCLPFSLFVQFCWIHLGFMLDFCAQTMNQLVLLWTYVSNTTKYYLCILHKWFNIHYLPRKQL